MTGRTLWLAGLITLIAALPGQAGEHKDHARLFPWVHSDKQAGCPREVAWYARPSETPAYTGYYVGGGAAIGGGCRCADEGTWGWDYHTFFLPRRVLLYWTHGDRYQGGVGAYRSDGGPHVPDLPGYLNPAVYSGHKHDHE